MQMLAQRIREKQVVFFIYKLAIYSVYAYISYHANFQKDSAKLWFILVCM